MNSLQTDICIKTKRATRKNMKINIFSHHYLNIFISLTHAPDSCVTYSNEELFLKKRDIMQSLLVLQFKTKNSFKVIEEEPWRVDQRFVLFFYCDMQILLISLCELLNFLNGFHFKKETFKLYKKQETGFILKRKLSNFLKGTKNGLKKN